MADTPTTRSAVAPVPDDYLLPSGPDFLLKTVAANINGSGAAGAYLPALQVLTPSGAVVWTAVPDVAVAAGASVLVSWFPGGGLEGGQSATPVGGGIDTLTSTGASITVSEPSGPTTNVDLPSSGVTPGTYGDSSHVAQVQVNADGIVTSAAAVGISGAVGGFTKLFDTTLSSPATTIDTGVGGVPAGYSGLMCYCLARRADAVASATLDVIINGDTGTNYAQLVTDNSNGVMTPSWATHQSAAKVCEIPGANMAANIFAYAVVWIPFYTGTVAFKGVVASGGFVGNATDSELVETTSTWFNTAAITQLTFQPGAGVNFVTGSRVAIYGLV